MALDHLPVSDPSRQMIPIMDDVRSAMAAVVESGRWLKGQQTAAFEGAFAEFVGTDHALGIGNGTDGLELALRAAGVEPGREVITVANAGGYTTTRSGDCAMTRTVSLGRRSRTVPPSGWVQSSYRVS
jgi:dTDP-4-amino-4,6-dideoxygalactose transaminase